MPADFEERRRSLGEDGGRAGRAGEGGHFAEDFAGAKLNRARAFEHAGHVLQEDARAVCRIPPAEFGRVGRGCRGEATYFRKLGGLPKLSNRLHPTFLRRGFAAEQGGVRALDADADIAREDQKGAVAVVALADDKIAGLVVENPCVAAEDFAERQGRRKGGRVHASERFDVEEHGDVGVGHFAGERNVPALGSGHGDFEVRAWFRDGCRSC